MSSAVSDDVGKRLKSSLPDTGKTTDHERSLSFSSSSSRGDDSKISNLRVCLDEEKNNQDMNNLRALAPAPLIKMGSSFKQLLSAASNPRDSYISTSANTAIMSNTKINSNGDCTSPPSVLGDEDDGSLTKRSIFGNQTKKKYNVRRDESDQNSHHSSVRVQASPELLAGTSVPTAKPVFNMECSPTDQTNKTLSTPTRTPCTPDNEDDKNSPPLLTVGCKNFLSPMSPLTPAAPYQNNNGGSKNQKYINIRSMRKISDRDESSAESTKDYAVQFDPTITRFDNDSNPSTPQKETMMFIGKSPQDSHHHAQALLLSLAFFFIWSPQNLLAPNLTQAAHDFGYGDDTRARDLYLGSNLALASSVLSLPFSAFIGFASDVVPSRRILISATTFVGGMAAIATGMSTTYPQLILSRFIGGSCMSGSVPVVFSLLSDWFDEKDRNAASSGFTAMMGAGMLCGQVYAGTTGPTLGWRHSFYTSGILTMIFAVVVMMCIREPVRGGKERILKEMLARGGKYDKKLTWSQFVSSMTTHSSNCLLLLQGFFCNLPWGVMFVFLNDFLSQEKGLSVPDATFIIAAFGLGSAAGGILGGYFGTLASTADRRYLPLFMSLTTLLGIVPFLALFDDPNYDHAGLIPCLYAFAGGCLASMPSVNVRPCIINVNPPEIRGAALTAANLIINAARGAGPTFLTTILMGMFGVDRASGFNIMIIFFWIITSIQLAMLSKTLPIDQERMESELEHYAMTSMDAGYGSISEAVDYSGPSQDGIESNYDDNITFDGDKSIFSIENQAAAFDATAAHQSFVFMGESLREIGDGLSFCSPIRDRGRPSPVH